MLFYAGTTHKMQGSQAKLIISLLGDVNYKGFITRNMMYTVYTRGIDYVYALGSVDNTSYSMLSKARTDIAEANISTILNHLVR
jgi:ATP-dependent exoDNAse (exonuclease V) alpha subunit